jgi:hypothetical protein
MSQIILNEGLNSLNRIKLMMKYDLSKTYSENSTIISEQVMAPGMNDYLAKNPIKPLKGMSVDEFMEGFREKLYSPGGIAVEAFLTSFGFTAPLVITSYAAMLAYDIHKGIQTGDYAWLDIIFDVLGVLTSGTLSGVLSGIMKSAKGIKGVDKALLYLKNSKVWEKILPYIKDIGISTIIIEKRIQDGIKFLVEKFGKTWLGQGLTKINSAIKTVLDTIQKTVSILVSKVAPKRVAVKAGQSARTGVHAAGVIAAAKPVIHKYGEYRKQKEYDKLLSNPMFSSDDAFD